MIIYEEKPTPGDFEHSANHLCKRHGPGAVHARPHARRPHCGERDWRCVDCMTTGQVSTAWALWEESPPPQPEPVPSERPVQLRQDTGKPRLSYLLSQVPSATVIAFGARTAASESLTEALCNYARGGDLAKALEAIVLYAKACEVDLAAEVAAIYEFGATKYERGNYLKGQTVCHYLDSAGRHLLALCRGETLDRESTRHHIGHIWWNVERSGDQTSDRDDRLFAGNKNLP